MSEPAEAPLDWLSWTLTTADALAYEALPRELGGWRRWAFLLWLAAAGLVLSILPVEWVGPEYGWRFWLLLLLLIGSFWGIATLAMTLAARRRASRRVAAPRSMELKRWGDHLEVAEPGRTFFVAYETIAGVSVTQEHVFITAPPEVVIVPRHAFARPEDFVLFGSEIDRLSNESAL